VQGWSVCVQSVLHLRDEMVAEGQLQSDVIGTVLPAHRHESVTTASQTDLSGEVSECRLHQLSTVHSLTVDVVKDALFLFSYSE